MRYNHPVPIVIEDRHAVDTGLNIADLFSRTSTSSRTTFADDFATKLSQARSMVQAYCDIGIAPMLQPAQIERRNERAG